MQLQTQDTQDTQDTHQEEKLKFTVIEADLQYYEKQVELANLHLRSIHQSHQTHADSPELRLAIAHAKKAYYGGQAAFAKLCRSFPSNSGMERLAALEEWFLQM